jgi:hypothetical protein
MGRGLRTGQRRVCFQKFTILPKTLHHNAIKPCLKKLVYRSPLPMPRSSPLPYIRAGRDVGGNRPIRDLRAKESSGEAPGIADAALKREAMPIRILSEGHDPGLHRPKVSCPGRIPCFPPGTRRPVYPTEPERPPGSGHPPATARDPRDNRLPKPAPSGLGAIIALFPPLSWKLCYNAQN